MFIKTYDVLINTKNIKYFEVVGEFVKRLNKDVWYIEIITFDNKKYILDCCDTESEAHNRFDVLFDHLEEKGMLIEA